MNTIPPECQTCGVSDSEDNPVDVVRRRPTYKWRCKRCAETTCHQCGGPIPRIDQTVPEAMSEVPFTCLPCQILKKEGK